MPTGDNMLEEKIIEWEKNNLVDDNVIEDMNVKILDLMCMFSDNKLEDQFEKIMTKLFYYESDKYLLLQDISEWKKAFKRVQISKYILDTPDFSDKFKSIIKDIKLRDLKRVASTIIPNEKSVTKNSKSLYKRTIACNSEKQEIICSLNNIISSYEKVNAPVLKLSRH